MVAKGRTALELTVFVIDDDDAARNSLVFLLRAEGLISRSYSSALDFLKQLQPEHHGCVITDVRMPEMDGIELVHALNAMGCQMPIIVITGHADVPLAVQAMKAGVSDFIEKPFESGAILAAVRDGLERARDKAAIEMGRQSVERRMALLTEREEQVLNRLCDGLTNKEIGLNLGISSRTVEIYRATVMTKMSAKSLSDLVRMALTASGRRRKA